MTDEVNCHGCDGVRRETGGWKWPLPQFGYMSALACAGAFLAKQIVTWLS